MRLLHLRQHIVKPKEKFATILIVRRESLWQIKLNWRLPEFQIPRFDDGAALDTIWKNFDRTLKLLTMRFLPGVEKGSACSLRQLSDKANAYLRALTTMKTTLEILDGLLIHLIASKLDHQVQERWEEALPRSCQNGTNF